MTSSVPHQNGNIWLTHSLKNQTFELFLLARGDLKLGLGPNFQVLKWLRLEWTMKSRFWPQKSTKHAPRICKKIKNKKSGIVIFQVGPKWIKIPNFMKVGLLVASENDNSHTDRQTGRQDSCFISIRLSQASIWCFTFHDRFTRSL